MTHVSNIVQAGGYRRIERVSIQGDVYKIWEPIMPRIRDEVLDCSIFLYPTEEQALAGSAYGGSGFLVAVRKEPDLNRHQLYAVTNSHVVEAGSPIVRLNAKEGGVKVVPLHEQDWIHHPEGDDIAIAPIHLDRETFKFRCVDVSGYFAITKVNAQRMKLGAGDETLMVGRFIGRDERQSNLPIVRFGHIAGAETERINQGGFLQESFLVETHSVPGFSGSPVFVWIPQDRIGTPTDPHLKAKYRQRVRQLGAGPQEFFLGIDWGHLAKGMACVVPAWKLQELLQIKEVVEMREKEFDEQAADEEDTPHGHLDTAMPKQKTRAGINIPIPTREQVEGVFKKATRKRKP